MTMNGERGTEHGTSCNNKAATQSMNRKKENREQTHAHERSNVNIQNQNNQKTETESVTTESMEHETWEQAIQ